MIKAVLFDMDGVMVDTEPLQHKAFAWLVEREGKKPELFDNGLVHKIGITEKENVVFLKDTYDLRGEVEVLVRARTNYYRKLLQHELKPCKGVKQLVKKLRAGGLGLAIASSSVRSNIELVLKLLKLDEAFGVVVSGQEVPRGKPKPDVYLEAAKRLGVEPKDCLVIEDSESGVLAALNAGMRVVAVPDQYTREGDFSKATWVVDSLEQIDLHALQSGHETDPGITK